MFLKMLLAPKCLKQKGFEYSVVEINFFHSFQEVLNQIRAKLENKVTNETLKLNMKIQSATDNFQILGTNLTEQLQRLEMREEKSWVSIEL